MKYEIPENILDAIESEREYQLTKWREADERNDIPHFMLYAQKYLDRAKDAYTAPGIGEVEAMTQLRKVTALLVAAMEKFDTGE